MRWPVSALMLSLRSSPRPFPQDLHRRVAAVDGDHAAAGMRAGAAEEDAGHRRPRREPAVPHVRREAFALEDVAADQSDLPLDVGRAEHLDVDDRSGHVVAEPGDRTQGQLLDIVAAESQSPRANVCGTYWAKTLIVCTPSGATLGSCAVWKYSSVQSRSGSSPARAVRYAARHSSLVSGVLIWPRWWGMPRARAARRSWVARCRATLSLTVQPTWGISSTRARQAGSAASPSRRSVVLGSAFDTTHGDSIRSPPASSTPLPGTIRATGRPGEHHGAGIAGDVAEDERDHAHPAVDISPHPRHPAQPARLVVEVDRRGPRVVRAGERADHPLAEIGRLEPFVIEVMLDKLDHRPVEEQRDGPRCHPPGRRSISSREGARPIQRSPPSAGRKRVAEPALHVAEGPPALQARRSQPADLLFAKRVVVPELHARAILERDEQPRAAPASTGTRNRPSPARRSPVGWSSPTRYAQGEIRCPGQTSRSVQAPPTCSRASRTRTRRPALAR